MSDLEEKTRLPLLGEAGRPAEREVVAAGQAEAPAAAAGAQPATAIVALHGVGDFEHGDLIGEIASAAVFARSDHFDLDTVFARACRYTVLHDRHDGRPRLIEVNWSDVRRAMPNLLGLLRHFYALLIALNRIGAHGAYRSSSLSQPLWTRWLTLWAVEGLLLWASLAPALSLLMWQLQPGERVAAGLLVAASSVYVAALVRPKSLQLAGGGVLFAVLALWAGWWACFDVEGRHDVAAAAAGLHTWSTLIAASAVLLSAAEILLRPLPATARGGGHMMHRLSRLACLWLPLVLVIVLQPLTVSLLLLPMDAVERTTWGVAFAREMPFNPYDGQQAAGWVTLALGGTLLLGALQFKLVQRCGRNLTVLFGWATGLSLLATARWLELRTFEGCEVCRYCLRTDWLGAAGLMLAVGASATWVLFARSDTARDPSGRDWYPAGAFARFWAGVMLAAVPIALTLTLGWSWMQVVEHSGEEVLADAAEVFWESTRYALLLAPLATRPFAAFLDALGDVFFFLVRQRNLTTRHDTQPRLWQALRMLEVPGDEGRRIVFAHSQGTVIAAVMLSRMARVLRRSSMQITLVTVGSPITTLYRNFLGARVGAEYAALCVDEPARFRWINLARPADYIGGAIEWPGVVNRDLLSPGDHVGYWGDAELLKWLKALSEGRAD